MINKVLEKLDIVLVTFVRSIFPADNGFLGTILKDFFLKSYSDGSAKKNKKTEQIIQDSFSVLSIYLLLKF